QTTEEFGASQLVLHLQCSTLKAREGLFYWSNQNVTETVTEGGQAQADSSGTTVAAPAQVQPSGGQAQTTGNGPGAEAEESFFDPRAIQDKPELMAAYKQMQGEFTKHMQKFASQRQRLEILDRFERDPIGTLQAIVPNYGYQLVQRGQEQPQDQEF